jgi:hypothetical protein
MTQLVTTEDILSTGGDYPERIKTATPEQRANAAVLAARVSALLAELGYKKRPPFSDGLRPQNATYGAKKSAHKEGKAVDSIDPRCELKNKIASPAEVAAGFSPLLKKHGLRMEHPDETGGKNTPLRPDGSKKTPWCHLDTRTPFGSIFHP